MNLISLIKYRQSAFKDSLENAVDLPAWVLWGLWVMVGSLIGLSWLIVISLIVWVVTG